MQTRWKWLCWLIGHRWQRYGYAARSDDHKIDDTQIMFCRRCFWLPLIGHNEPLPRFKEKVGD